MVAWPPACLALMRTVCVSASVIHQRWAPPHSIRCVPGRCIGSAIDGSESRHKADFGGMTAKNGADFSRKPHQKRSASTASTTSPPNYVRAAFTAASAPPRRKASVWSRHALPVSGNGWPLHSLSLRTASVSFISYLSVVSATGFGSTFTDTSRIIPSVPRDPASSRETSYPATFFTTCPPKCSTWPWPFITTAPSTKSRGAPAAARRGPASPAAIQPPSVAFGPKCGGSNGSIWPHSSSRASISLSGVPAFAVITSSAGSYSIIPRCARVSTISPCSVCPYQSFVPPPRIRSGVLLAVAARTRSDQLATMSSSVMVSRVLWLLGQCIGVFPHGHSYKRGYVCGLERLEQPPVPERDVYRYATIRNV